MNSFQKMDDGTKYGDDRLNWRLRNKAGEERPLFKVAEDDGTVELRSEVMP